MGQIHRILAKTGMCGHVGHFAQHLNVANF